jgi:hypothetical protein
MADDKKQRMFPVLYSHGEERGLKEVPWDFLKPHESQAFKNHDQSLETLASRGGLGLDEMLAIVREVSWFREVRGLSKEARLAGFNAALNEYYAQQQSALEQLPEMTPDFIAKAKEDEAKLFKAERDAALARLEEVVRELEATKKAKQENDARFMRERGEAREECLGLRSAMAIETQNANVYAHQKDAAVKERDTALRSAARVGEEALEALRTWALARAADKDAATRSDDTLFARYEAGSRVIALADKLAQESDRGE